MGCASSAPRTPAREDGAGKAAPERPPLVQEVKARAPGVPLLPILLSMEAACSPCGCCRADRRLPRRPRSQRRRRRPPPANPCPSACARCRRARRSLRPRWRRCASSTSPRRTLGWVRPSRQPRRSRPGSPRAALLHQWSPFLFHIACTLFAGWWPCLPVAS